MHLAVDIEPRFFYHLFDKYIVLGILFYKHIVCFVCLLFFSIRILRIFTVFVFSYEVLQYPLTDFVIEEDETQNDDEEEEARDDVTEMEGKDGESEGTSRRFSIRKQSVISDFSGELLC